MDLNVWFRLHWKDPRLAWNASEWGVHKLYVLNQELRVRACCPSTGSRGLGGLGLVWL